MPIKLCLKGMRTLLEISLFSFNLDASFLKMCGHLQQVEIANISQTVDHQYPKTHFNFLLQRRNLCH